MEEPIKGNIGPLLNYMAFTLQLGKTMYRVIRFKNSKSKQSMHLGWINPLRKFHRIRTNTIGSPLMHFGFFSTVSFAGFTLLCAVQSIAHLLFLSL